MAMKPCTLMAFAAAMAIAGCSDRRAAERAATRVPAGQLDADDGRAQVDELTRKLARLDAVLAGQDDNDDCDEAPVALEQRRREELETARRIRAAGEAAFKAERARRLFVSKECLETPLAKGCG